MSYDDGALLAIQTHANMKGQNLPLVHSSTAWVACSCSRWFPVKQGYVFLRNSLNPDCGVRYADIWRCVYGDGSKLWQEAQILQSVLTQEVWRSARALRSDHVCWLLAVVLRIPVCAPRMCMVNIEHPRSFDVYLNLLHQNDQSRQSAVRPSSQSYKEIA